MLVAVARSARFQRALGAGRTDEMGHERAPSSGHPRACLTVLSLESGRVLPSSGSPQLLRQQRVASGLARTRVAARGSARKTADRSASVLEHERLERHVRLDRVVANEGADVPTPASIDAG